MCVFYCKTYHIPQPNSKINTQRNVCLIKEETELGDKDTEQRQNCMEQVRGRYLFLMNEIFCSLSNDIFYFIHNKLKTLQSHPQH